MYMFPSLFLQGWLLYTSKSVACSLHSVPIQNMYKQPTDFVGIISLSLSLTHVYAQPLVGIYRWLSMAIDCFLYILSFVFIIENELLPHRPSSNISSQIECWYGGGGWRLESLYAQPLVGTYCWMSMAIDCFFIYIVVCVYHRKRIASPSSILQHSSQIECSHYNMVGVRG